MAATYSTRARWLIGIALQGWRNLGWTDDLRVNYMLFRDRKTLLTSWFNVLGYAASVLVVGIWLASSFIPDAYRYPPLVAKGTWLYDLIVIDTAFFALRLGERAYCTYQWYGPMQAALSMPRQFWGNIINFGAGVRATWLYMHSRISGRALAWAK